MFQVAVISQTPAECAVTVPFPLTEAMDEWEEDQDAPRFAFLLFRFRSNPWRLGRSISSVLFSLSGVTLTVQKNRLPATEADTVQVPPPMAWIMPLLLMAAQTLVFELLQLICGASAIAALSCFVSPCMSLIVPLFTSSACAL